RPPPPPPPPRFPYTTLFRSSTGPSSRTVRPWNRSAKYKQAVARRCHGSMVTDVTGATGATAGVVDVADGGGGLTGMGARMLARRDRKSTRLNSSHRTISYAV